ncbi:GNAT family N-acetyltransferase [Nonomuraea sp. NPDC003804]|uniref:GNAT family N-acetyltransferase n=1 Tax=Nonomuraea sp. NPDC003804 TaxID=3154547 RepID=UPI0033ACD10D
MKIDHPATATPHPLELDIRPVPEDDLDKALRLSAIAFHDNPDDETRERHRELLLRCERLGAYEGDRLVGFLAALQLDLSVPGGDLPCAGVTFVCVLPIHRRRGVLTKLIDELWRAGARQGRPLAALWASDAAVYGRFGFGFATYGMTIEIDSGRPLDLRIEADPRPLRLLEPADAQQVVAPLYERSRTARAGRLRRDDTWWDTQVLPEKEEEDGELGPPLVVVVGDADAGGPPAGYAIYRTRPGNDDTNSPGLVQVQEFEADSAPVAAALWRYLAGIDLTERVRCWAVPVDDPLPLMAADPDQVRVTQVFGCLWLRLADVRQALLARAWAAPFDLVLQVRDAALPANAGRFRLTAGPDTAIAYEPTADPADLTMDVRELAACYLGGALVTRFVRAGLVAEHTPGAAATLDAALRTERPAFTMDEF